MLQVIEYFAKSLEVNQGNSKWCPWEGRVFYTLSKTFSVK